MAASKQTILAVDVQFAIMRHKAERLRHRWMLISIGRKPRMK